MEGFFNLNKPAGPTSHDMVDLVRRYLHQRRVGHGGTLDPLAQGVLPIGLGRATRLLSFIQDGEKVYRANVRLGLSTTTYDAEGEVTAERVVPSLSELDLQRALRPFLGEVEQIPPSFSAIRQGGRRLYELARAGEVVVPPVRRVQIHRLEILSWQSPHLVLEVACGRGTYIRSLAHDLGESLGCGGHVTHLVRLQVGPFHLAQALAPEELASALQERAEQILLPVDFPVQHWPILKATEQQVADVLNGRALALSPAELPAGQERARVYDGAGRFLALLRFEGDRHLWHPFRVFPPLEHQERPV